MSSSEDAESPRKRLKLSTEAQPLERPGIANFTSPPLPSYMFSKDRAGHAAKEAEVGITEYVSLETPGFRGVLKKRYTDFLVNEILPNGKVVHLEKLGSAAVSQPGRNSEPAVLSEQNGTNALPLVQSSSSSLLLPPPATTETPRRNEAKTEQLNDRAVEKCSSPVSVEDISKLITYLGDTAAEKLLTLYNKILSSPDSKSREHGVVTAVVPAEKSVRTALHNDIRRIFEARIDSSTDKENNSMTFSAAIPHNRKPSSQRGYYGNQPRGQGKLGWADRGGEYLHFCLYKENKDTMEVISYLTKQLKMNAKIFQFAGTKDRRAVTVQRISAFRLEENRLANQNKALRNSAVGDFEYQKHGLELGDLKGNEFVITLRDCQWEHAQNSPIKEKTLEVKEAMSQACRILVEKGFFNYYGLQRFGTFSMRTDVVGLKLLQGDFRGACEAILHYNPHVLVAAQDSASTEQIGSDDKARAEAISIFQETGRVNEALDKLPRKFSAEGNLIRHLGKNKKDHAGAIQTIQRNLRLMYVHAYQSLVWNFAVGERWRVFRSEVVEGDLVLVNDHKDKQPDAAPLAETVDADGEVVIQPTGVDRAQAVDDMFERARALTAEEAASGEYSIFDIVLPLPGYDILYPTNAISGFYKTFMGSERGGGLDPSDMRRKTRDFSLSGSYRKILARIGSGYDVQVRAYKDDNEQFVDTDLDIIKKQSKSPSVQSREPEDGDKLAVVLKMQLGSSQYATMALRELSKSGVEAYKPDFGVGR